ncbi:MAG TPA: DUF5677 domain-containing protein [Verrucomicrobiae bacterium]|nr:DUF5677 domain-containing protein [Verrucomicrobiae bacterium]
MLVSFAIKQTEHARSVLKLGTSPDTMLIARSMLEGLSQLLWAMKQPTRRPLLWRAFAFVLDWRLLQRHRAEGRTIDSDVERHTHAGLRRHGRWFLTKEARQARANGRLLPLDPYVKNWYGEREVEIFRDVGGQVLLEHAYGPFSEWHHWRIGAIGRLVSFDAGAREFTMTTFRPSSVALAVACAFQCLWQTMWLMNARCHLRIGRQLRHLHHQQVSIPRP